MIRKRLQLIGQQIVEDLAERTYALSQKYVPVASGALKRSGKVRKYKNGSSAVVYTARYARVIEYGRDGGTESVSGYAVKRHRRMMQGKSILVKRHHVAAFRRKTGRRDGVHFLQRAYEQTIARDVKAQLHAAVQSQSRK